jgi:hypothetical protein
MIQLATTRRLVEHQFESDGHVYRVPGEFVLSTSDVIELNGLSDVSMIPLAALQHAGHRGTALHAAVLAFETGRRPELAIQECVEKSGYPRSNHDAFLNEVMERLWFYRSWRSGRTVKLAGEMEVPRVYRHEGTGFLIGATADLPIFIDGVLYVADLKTGAKQYGAKAQMDQLKWKLQTQSYKEAYESDEEFWRKIARQEMRRIVLHLHPECGKTGTRGTQTGWEQHPFDDDDSFAWDSAVRMAMLKIKHGYKLARRDVEQDLKANLRASLECEDQPIF